MQCCCRTPLAPSAEEFAAGCRGRRGPGQRCSHEPDSHAGMGGSLVTPLGLAPSCSHVLVLCARLRSALLFLFICPPLCHCLHQKLGKLAGLCCLAIWRLANDYSSKQNPNIFKIGLMKVHFHEEDNGMGNGRGKRVWIPVSSQADEELSPGLFR